MKLGHEGAMWVNTLYEEFSASDPGTLDKKSEEFLTDYFAKVHRFDKDTFISPKQHKWLNEIATKLGCDELPKNRLIQER